MSFDLKYVCHLQQFFFINVIRLMLVRVQINLLNLRNYYFCENINSTISEAKQIKPYNNIIGISKAKSRSSDDVIPSKFKYR